VGLALFATIVLATGGAEAAGRKIDLADVTAEPPIAGLPAAGLAWRPDGRSFSYLTRNRAAVELWMEDAVSGRKTLVASTATFPPDSAASNASLDDYRWSPDGRTVLFTAGRDLWLLPVGKTAPDRLTMSGGIEHPSFSPDGKRIAFVRANDLVVLDVSTKRETRLTRDGSTSVHNGKLDWVYEEELANRTGRSYDWSPDSSAIAYSRLDETRVVPSPIVDYLAVPPSVAMLRYARAGTPNAIPSFHVAKTDGTELAAVHFDPDDVYLLPHFSWTADSKAVCYRVMNRAQRHQDVILLYPADLRSKTLFSEDDPFWLNAVEPPRFLGDGRFVWLSERDGFRHVYLGEIGAGSPRAVTSGAWLVDTLAGVDEKNGLVYFSATEDNPRRRPLYRVGLDGRGFTRLTTGRGTHRALLSPGGQFLLDTFSTADTPPVRSLLDAGGKHVRVIEEPANRLAEFALATTEEIEVSAPDGVKLLARLTKPADFDPAKKYPVIVFLYGGPLTQVVRDAWGAVSLMDQVYAGRGWLVWSLDNRGAAGRGHAFETPIWRNTGAHELADQLTGVEYLKSLPYVDGARIGITGWSYGGYMTLYAMTHAPGVWKCGVAGAPVTHWKLYDTIGTERYMSTPQENPAGYESSAPLSRAKDLRAPLLIIHGTSDDNVHLQNTLVFVDALVKAGKPYELHLQPGERHGFRGKAAIDSRNEAMVTFFEEHL